MKNDIFKSVVCCGFTPCVQRIIEFGRITLGDVNRARRVTVGIGGKGANTARMVHQLGGDSLHLGFVGGANGRLFEHLLKQDNVRFKHVQTVGETRYCQTLLEAGNPESTELVEEMPVLESGEWEQMEALLHSLDLSGIVTISGKQPAGIPVDAYARIVRAVNKCGGNVILDAPGEPMLLALKERPFMVKINRSELAAVLDSGEVLLERGAQSALITDGARLTTYYTKGASQKLYPPGISAVNAVGSGDAVTAGVAYELSRGNSALEAVQTGMACGAANALNLISGMLILSDVTRLRNAVRFGD